jgi:ABC-type Fe3+ transport system substrate-binding protein
MDLDGTAEYSPVVPVGVAPSRFALLPNAPNPVRGTTQLRYMLSEEATVSLRVYDLLGRRVASLVDAEQRAGRYTVTLDGTSLSSGTYVVRLQADGQTATRRLAVVR